MWINQSFYKYSVGIILILTIILLLYITSPVFLPILWFVAAILLPLLFSTLLYYILRPVVDFLDRWMSRFFSIFLTYIGVTLLFLFLSFWVIPQLARTMHEISTIKLDGFKEGMGNFFEQFKYTFSFFNYKVLEDAFLNYLPKINTFIYNLIVNLVGTLAGIAIGLLLTPFVLYYFLRDDRRFMGSALRYIPEKFRDEVQKIFMDIDTTLSQFILTQLTVAGVIGTFLFMGYWMIGLPNALSLALFAMIFYVIPILGTFIAIIPALIVGVSISFMMVLKVIAVMFVAHFFETNLLTPRLISNRLHIHPLTVIFLLLAGGSLYGLLGLLLITPTYAILKVIVWNLYKIYRLHYSHHS